MWLISANGQAIGEKHVCRLRSVWMTKENPGKLEMECWLFSILRFRQIGLNFSLFITWQCQFKPNVLELGTSGSVLFLSACWFIGLVKILRRFCKTNFDFYSLQNSIINFFSSPSGIILTYMATSTHQRNSVWKTRLFENTLQTKGIKRRLCV